MNRKKCVTLTKELKHYLHEQEHEMARLLKSEPNIVSNATEANYRLLVSSPIFLFIINWFSILTSHSFLGSEAIVMGLKSVQESMISKKMHQWIN